MRGTAPFHVSPGHTSDGDLLEFSPDVICALDRAFRFVRVSAAAKELWGYSPEELTGKCLLDFLAEEDRAAIRQACESGVGLTYLTGLFTWFLCPGGRRQPTLWSLRWCAEKGILYGVARDGSTCQEAEKRAGEYKQRLYRAYKLVQIGWWEWHSAGAQILISDELLQIYGISRDHYPTFTTKDYLALVHPEDREGVQEQIRHIHQTEHHQYGHRMIKPDGEVIHVIHYLRTERDAAGRVVKCHGTTQDITARRKVEMELRQSQQRLESIVESLGDGFLALDHQGLITYWNRKAERVTGKKREMMVGRNFYDLYPRATTLKFQREFSRAVNEQVSVHFEEYSPSYSSWMEVNAYPTSEGLSVFIKDISARKKHEEDRRLWNKKLRKVQENLHEVLESMSDGFYTVDRAWNITFATEKVAAMLGVRKQDYLGKNHWVCFPAVVQRRFYPEYHRAFAQNTLVSFEEYLPSYGLWVEVSAYPKGDELSVYVKDISLRKRQEKRLEFMAKATSELIWERALDAAEMEINPEKLQQLFGYEVNSRRVPFSFWSERIDPEDWDRAEENRKYALQHDFDFYVNEYRFKKADGTWAHIKDRTYVLKNGEGRAVALMGAMEDITSVRLSERALVESEKTYRSMFNNAPFPEMIVDPETLRILDVNSTAVELYGYSREEFGKMTILDIRPEEEHLKVSEFLTRFDRDRHNKSGIVVHLKKGGERMIVEVTVARVEYKGKLCNLASIFDLTEKIKLQEALLQEKINFQKGITKAAIEAQEKERSEIGRELHDNVNQLLTTAKLYVENIRYYPEQGAQFATRSVDILQRSISEIRRLSRVLITPTIRDVGFKDTLHELVAYFQELNLFTINTLFCLEEASISPDVKLTIYRILQEAFNNTIKYARATQVHLSIQCSEKHVHLNYQDDGVGFDPATIKRGMGLQNIQNRTEAYRGTVLITAAPGSGCSLRIELPLTEESS